MNNSSCQKELDYNEILKYYDMEVDVGPNNKECTLNYVQKNKIDTIKRTVALINRSIDFIRSNWKDASPLEIYIGFRMSTCDAEEMILNLSDPTFRKKLNKEYNAKMLEYDPSYKANSDSDESLRHDSQEEEEESYSEDDDDSDSDFIAPKSIANRNKNKRENVEDDVIERFPKEADMDAWGSWSTIRRTSYLSKENKNQFFYRNVAPGEVRKNGPWDEEEKKLFLKRVDEMKEKYGEIYQWGIFSQAIPGRVGYQCANYYRKLIDNGEIIDDNFKLKSLENRFKIKQKISSDDNNTSSKKDFYIKKKLSKYDRLALENPLKGQIDLITEEEIRVPAMSPSGYILDYNTWKAILNSKLEDPFTREHLEKEQLVILTTKNIKLYYRLLKNIL